MRRITKVASIVLLLVGMTFVARFNEHRYDFKETLTKVSGKYGYGSGNVVESGKDYSLILTNKHVCVGTNVNPVIEHTMQFISMIKNMYPECSTFSCLQKSDPMFGPTWLMILLNLQVNNVKFELKSESIDDFVAQLLAESEKAKNLPLEITFNNLPISRVNGKIHAVSKYADLCLVKIPVGNLPVMLISDTKPKVGDKVVTIGNPQGVLNHMVAGYVGNEVRIWGNMYQMITAQIYGGQSGSATFDMDGYLVGVNTLSRPDIPTIGYMIVLDDIKLFLQGNLINRKIRMKL